MFWSYLLTAVGVVGLFLVGRKKKIGFVIGIAAQLLWVAYALATDQYGFILSAIIYGVVNLYSLGRWIDEENIRKQAEFESAVRWVDEKIEDCPSIAPWPYPTDGSSVHCKAGRGHHPDRHGGDGWTWSDIDVAYAKNIRAAGEEIEWDIDANLPMYTRDYLKLIKEQ